MKGVDLKVKLLLFMLFLLCFSAYSKRSWAQTIDWKPELVTPSQGEFRTPADEFRIFIPPELPVEVLQSLSLELDGIDVTAMISREGEYALFVPPQPLAWGEHTLRLVENVPDGSILERGLWTFEVRKSDFFRESEFNVNLNLIATQRAADHNLGGTPKKGQAQGGIALNGALANNNWQMTGSADLIYNSQSDQTFNDRELDLGEFLLTGSVGPAQLDIGHHSVESDNMVMEGFHRRGISAGLSTKNQLARVTGFMMRTENITGFQEGLGVGDPDKRVFGVAGNTYLFPNDPGKLFLSAMYLKGEGEETGVGEGGDTESAGGNAWSLTADARVINKRIRLRGEYASTDFDFDGPNTGFDKEQDHAYSLLSVYTHPEKTFKGMPLRWSMGLEHKRVGTFFHSLANPGFPNDKRSISAFAEIGWSVLNINTVVGRETDNVEDDPLLPRTQTDQVTVSTTYSTIQEAPQGKWNLFGQPFFQGALSHTKQKQTQTPSGFSGGVTNNRTRELILSASFTPGNWNWAISHAISLFDDYSNLSSDTRNNFSNLSAGFQVGERLSLTPNIQHNLLDDKDTGVDTTSLTAGLGITFVLFPERLNGSLNLSLNQESTSDDSIDTTTSIFDGSMVWAIKLPKPNRPGVDLFVNGNYQNVDDKVTPGSSAYNYQVFSGIRVSWPLAY